MSCCLCLVFTVLARFRSDCARVSHAAATHQPSHNSLLCFDTFHKKLVTQRYSLAATTHGALHASKFVVSLVRVEHSSSVHTVPRLHKLLLVITRFRCPWFSSACCMRSHIGLTFYYSFCYSSVVTALLRSTRRSGLGCGINFPRRRIPKDPSERLGGTGRVIKL
jgi:hypothetical protein